MRTILTLLFLPLVPPAALAANLGLIGGDVGNVAIYGDSMSNDGNPESCEWCDPLTDAGLIVWGMAQAGARTYYDTSAGPLYYCDNVNGYVGCEFYGERMTEYYGNACRRDYGSAVYTGDTAPYPTCIADLPLSAQTVDVFFFGANDIRNNTFATWYSSGDRALSLDAWRKMLDASDAAGHSNVIVLGPPYLKADVGFSESDGALVDLHVALRTKCASRPRCVIADVYSVFRRVETIYGTDALHDMYNNLIDDCPDTECIHPGDGPTDIGIRPNDMVGEIILNAIRRANDKRISAVE
jgi:hypothetical protein